MLHIACYAHSMKTTISINIDARLAVMINNKFHGKTENPDTGQRWKSKSEVAEYYLARGLGQASLIKNRPEKSRRQSTYLNYNIDPNTLNDSAEELNTQLRHFKTHVMWLLRSIAYWKLDFTSSKTLEASQRASGMPAGVPDPEDAVILNVTDQLAVLIPHGDGTFNPVQYKPSPTSTFYDFMMYIIKWREALAEAKASEKESE